MTSDEPVAETAEEMFRHAREAIRRRLQAGDDCRTEEYLAAYPGLAADERRVIELIQVEWQGRRDRGDSPPLSDWLDRFPRWAMPLRAALQAAESSSNPSTVEQKTGEGWGSSALDDWSVSLDHLELRDRIGRGGMGVVFRAWDPTLERFVAVKMLRDAALADSVDVERFGREARAAAALRHPNLVPVYARGHYRGQHAFVMELIAGGSLAEHLDEVRGDARRAATLLEQVARAVQCAHEHGVLHRDLKPANVLLDEQGQPRVSDFGLARPLEAEQGLTQTGGVVGTPAYMAPELLPGGGGRPSVRSDVWSLGVMLYELIAGRRPFQADNATDLARLIRKSPPIPVDRCCPNTDGRLQDIIDGCLDPVPEHRYGSVQALADDLAAWLAGGDLRARPRRRNARRSLALAGLAVLLLGGLALGIVLWPGGDGEKDRPEWLIGETGNPRVAYRWLGEPGKLEERLAPDGSYQVEVQRGHAILLLRDEAPRPAYRLEGELRQDGGPECPELGLVFGCWEQAVPGGPACTYFRWSFAESGLCTSRAQLYWEGNARHYLPGMHPFHTAGGREDGPWRRLAVDVTGTNVVLWWTDETGQLQAVSRQRREELRKNFQQTYGVPDADAPFFAGLGVYVSNATVSVRRLRVQTLNAD